MAETSIASAQENAFATQAIQLSKLYGTSSGNAYTMMAGDYVTALTIYGAYLGYTMGGIGVTFSNGATALIGTATSSSIVVDLSQDTISKMSVSIQQSSSFGGGSGIGGIYIETVRGHVYNNLGTNPNSNPKGWLPVLAANGEPAANIVLVGLTGKAGQAVDSVSFYFKNDVLMAHGMTGVNYSNLASSPKTPMNVATATLDNRTAEEQTMSVSFSRSVASTYTFSTTAGVSAGVSTTVEAGVPFVAGGSVEVSATMTFEATMGVAKTLTDTFQYNASISVPTNTTIIANALATTYSISGGYSAQFSEVWVHAGAVTKSVSGTISGLTAYDVNVSYTTVPSS